MIIIGTIANDFTPKEGKSNYFKMTPGDHRIRVLGNSISGWLYWTETPDGGRKPVRLTADENPPVEFAETVKKFLTFPIWNYETEQVQVWEITQSSIQKTLQSLDNDEDWGALTEYDLAIGRTGTDMNNTKYTVTPKPKSALPKKAQELVDAKALPVLDALFKGGDPFKFNPNAPDGSEDVSDEELDKVFKS